MLFELCTFIMTLFQTVNLICQSNFHFKHILGFWNRMCSEQQQQQQNITIIFKLRKKNSTKSHSCKAQCFTDGCFHRDLSLNNVFNYAQRHSVFCTSNDIENGLWFWFLFRRIIAGFVSRCVCVLPKFISQLFALLEIR